MLSKICVFIWDFCEYHHISLGVFAPYVFGGIIGRMPKKVKNNGQK